jgi:hypothetical protein
VGVPDGFSLALTANLGLASKDPFLVVNQLSPFSAPSFHKDEFLHCGNRTRALRDDCEGFNQLRHSRTPCGTEGYYLMSLVRVTSPWRTHYCAHLLLLSRVGVTSTCLLQALIYVTASTFFYCETQDVAGATYVVYTVAWNSSVHYWCDT